MIINIDLEKKRARIVEQRAITIEEAMFLNDLFYHLETFQHQPKLIPLNS